MTSRQFSAPHVVSSSEVKRLERIELDGRDFSEADLQALLYANPRLLPIADLEPLFDGLVPLAREFPTEAGPIDLVYVNAGGHLTLVETKLWRNPEARRQVVAQIIDYATALSKLSYEEFCAALSRSQASVPDPALAALADGSEQGRGSFIDALSRNLSKGRFLLLIAGDGIQEGVEHLAETLARSPQLSFSLALVELAMFRMGESSDQYLVLPRTLARTREVVRAVIQLKDGLTAADVIVSLPSAEPQVGGAVRRRLTEEALIEEIGKSTSKAVADQFSAFLREADAVGLEPTARDASLSLFWHEPNTGRRFTLGSVTEDARVSTSYVLSNFHKAGLDDAIGRRYLKSVASLVPGAMVKEKATRDGSSYMTVTVSDGHVSVADLLKRAPEWLAAIQNFIVETDAAGSEALKSGS